MTTQYADVVSPQLRDGAKITSVILAWSFARWLRCSLLTDPWTGYARRSRLASGQNPRAKIPELIFAQSLKAYGIGGLSTALAAVLVALLNCVPVAFAAEETCARCGQEVTLSGEFAHRRDDASLAVEGAGADAALFREEVYGKNFTVTLAHLPAGKYTVTIGEAETWASAPGERIFNVTSGNASLAKDFDIIATAGGPRKVCFIAGAVEHEDDSIHGPLTVSFSAIKGKAKFNTFEVKNAAGESVVSFSASEMADTFSAAATHVPEISEPPIWRDSSQPLPVRANDLIRRMSLAEKVAQLQNGAPGIPRLGLPAYNYWNEALHGVANNGVATVFPEPIGGASTWNPQLLRQEGNVIGVEGRAKFNDYATRHNGDSKWWYGLTFWTPNINIFRDPRWGRGQETYGEDPYLTGEIGVEFVKGVQGDDPKYMLAMACAKHYAVHSGPEADRHRFDAEISERDLFETYLPQFERVVREGKVGGVMGAYNSVNGVPCCASRFLLEDLLRKQWGFDGYVVSDCDAIHDIWGAQQHHYVNSPEEAAAAAVKAGCNLCCGGDYNSLVRAVQEGLITEKEINGALYHTLWTRFRLGLFDPADANPYSKIGMDQNDTGQHQELALQIARQSLVLLKNNGILPLDRSKLNRIAVIGPNGNSISMLHGNYHGSASHPISILNGIRQLAGTNIEVTFAQGCPITTKTDRGTAPWSRQDNDTTRPVPELKVEALNCATDADLVIYVGGITPAQEGEMFDRDSIELPAVQEELVRALQAIGKPIVMVNCSGSAVALPWEDEHLPAILQAWYPGEEGGRAVAEVLFGDVNPSGHLPVTFYRATADLSAFTNYSMADRTYRYFGGKPLYAFGHGLSYTRFEFKSGRLESKKIPVDGTTKVAFTVKNSGRFDGDEVAQVYFRHVSSAGPQPRLALCGFARVHLKPGQSGKVSVAVPTTRLRYWDAQKHQYVVEPGDYEFLIGAASDDIRLRLPLTITAR
ncbi:MAG TPA: glycoside hydrolase family 3 C-terminal domain-containing protein [Candidatus Acidoferrales bacterium]|nr:glycoside hydrolase family 3 C-terminal domain-containing protein [Candidatus Acidoferrales bacterium]